jgi:peptidoglycan-N-acetylglucosamine deacetylase
MNRGVLILGLCGLLCLLGTVTFYADASTLDLFQAAYPHMSNGHDTLRTTSANAQAERRYTHPVLRHTQQAAQRPFGYPVYYGNTRLPEIALTFDDGPNPVYTPQVLAILQTYRVKATFFDVGYLVKDFPGIVRQEFLQGHSIGNHSWSHPQLTRLSAAGIASQLVSTSDAIQAVTGTRPTIFRPPYGSYNRIVFDLALRQNLSTILWNNEARDWTLPGVNAIVYRILTLARNGGIILLHDGGGFRYQTVAALPIIITALRQRGFTFVTIPQLLHDMGASGKPSPSPSPLATDAVSFPIPLAAGLIIWKQE